MIMFNAFFRTLLLFVLILLAWQILHFYFIPQSFLPSTIDVSKAFAESLINGELLHHVVASLRRVTIGFIAAAILGIALGILGGSINAFGRLIKPLIEMLRPIPPIAWIPIAILLLGLGDISAYFIVFLGAFFPIFINTYFGAISIPVIYKNIAGSFEVRSLNYLWRIVLFYSLPAILTGLKIGVGMAWMSVIAAELVGAQTGLGYFIEINRLLLRTDNIVVGMISIGIVGSALTLLMSWIGKIAMPWRK